MARCNCAGLGAEGCMCALQAGENVTVTGTGQALDPWVVNGVPPAPYTEGTAIDIVANAISVDVSSDAGNSLVVGGDGGLFVPAASGGSPLGQLVYSTVGAATWTKAAYPDAAILRVRVVGGGGGSASTGAVASGQGIARGGGGGGGYSESWLDVSSLTASVSVTVGAGGAGGSSAGTATAGGTGGSSSFGTYVVAFGGIGSSVSAAPGVPPVLSPGGAAGAVGTGQIATVGSSGASGLWTSAAVGGRSGGMGGASGGGFGAAGYPIVFVGSGKPGNLYGGGASGPVREGVHAGTTGSDGGQGIVLVEMYQ